MFGLKKRVEELELELERQYKRIKQIECDHFNVDYYLYHYDFIDGNSSFKEVCKTCGKFLRIVDQKEKARMEYEQAKQAYNRVKGE